MLLSEQEFLAIKTEFVEQVLEKLRQLAELEAQALFREARLRPDVTLPQLSAQISTAISAISDAMSEELAELNRTGRLPRRVIYQHLPAVLRPYAMNRWSSAVPDEYSCRVVAASIARAMVYREGPSFLSRLSPSMLPKAALHYAEAELEVQRLTSALAQVELRERDKIARLLLAAGPRALLVESQL